MKKYKYKYNEAILKAGYEQEREYLQNILEQADQENKSVEDIVINRIDNLYDREEDKLKKGVE